LVALRSPFPAQNARNGPACADGSKYSPTIVARANAEKDGREGEFDAALSAFCDEWNLGTPEQARFEQEYLVVVGTRR
jgi:hypothetical protein